MITNSTFCMQGFKPVFYLLYVDDIFILFKSKDHLKVFSRFPKFLSDEHVIFYENRKTEQIILCRSWIYTQTR